MEADYMERDLRWPAKCGVALLSTLIAGAVNAKPGMFDALQFDPYMGAEYSYTHIKLTPGWTQILPSNFTNWGIFVGNRYHKNFGIELGYYHTIKKHQQSSFLLGFGTPQPGGGPGTTLVVGSMRNQGFIFEWDAFYQLDPNFEVLALIALVTTHPNVQFTASGNTGLDEALMTVTGSNKPILRLGVGYEYREKRWGARGKVCWDGTQTMKLNVSYVGNNYTYLTPNAFKQAITVSVGVFYRF